MEIEPSSTLISSKELALIISEIEAARLPFAKTLLSMINKIHSCDKFTIEVVRNEFGALIPHEREALILDTGATCCAESYLTPSPFTGSSPFAPTNAKVFGYLMVSKHFWYGRKDLNLHGLPH